MRNVLKACIWAGPVGFGFFGLGLLALAGFVPPPAPSLSVNEVAHLYQDNVLGIRLGSIMMMFGASMFAPFFAAYCAFMRRMEGEGGFPLTWTQAMSGTTVCTCFFLGAMLLSITAYRPERPAEITYFMNDFTWILFILPGPPAFFQTLAFGLGILVDKNEILPRWTGYFSIWVAVVFVPIILGVMFKTGPFAWNGLFSFWIGAGIVGIWANIMAFQMLKAIKTGKYAVAA